MFHYIKTIENLNNLSNGCELCRVIGIIKNIKNNTLGQKMRPSYQFTLYSTDTDISFECDLNKGNIEIDNTHYHNGDVVIVSGRYSDGRILVWGLTYAPLGLTGNMMQDVLILSEEMNSLISVQGQNGYISDNAWGKLQESIFEFRDIVKEITYFGGETFDEKY